VDKQQWWPLADIGDRDAAGVVLESVCWPRSSRSREPSWPLDDGKRLHDNAFRLAGDQLQRHELLYSKELECEPFDGTEHGADQRCGLAVWRNCGATAG
jgi:hypothetical protein